MIKIFKEEFNLINFLKFLKYHIKFIVAFVSIFTLLSIGFSFVAPVKFKAKATLQPPDENASVAQLSGLMQTLGGFPSLQTSQVSKTGLFIEYLHSRELADYIIDTLNLIEHPLFKDIPRTALESIIPAIIETNVQRTGIILLEVETGTGIFASAEERSLAAQLSADITNTAIEALDNISRNKTVSKAKRKRMFIEKILQIKCAELDSIDKAIESFQENNKIIGLDKQAQSTLASAVSVGAELARAEIELNTKLVEYEPESSVIESLQNKVSNLRRQFTQMQSGGINSSDKISLPVEQLPKLVRQYTNLLRDQKILEQVKLYLETQHYQEAIQEQSDLSVVETIDTALIPQEKYSPSKKLIVALGFFLSLAFSIIIVTIKAYIKGNFYYKEK
jgi:uncharacterized protein involved in exopolysaccharide biosynthesis